MAPMDRCVRRRHSWRYSPGSVGHLLRRRNSTDGPGSRTSDVVCEGGPGTSGPPCSSRLSSAIRIYAECNDMASGRSNDLLDGRWWRADTDSSSEPAQKQPDRFYWATSRLRIPQERPRPYPLTGQSLSAKRLLAGVSLPLCCLYMNHLPSYVQIFQVRSIVVLITAATGRHPIRQANAWVWRGVTRSDNAPVPSQAVLDRCGAGPPIGTTPSIMRAATCLLATATGSDLGTGMLHHLPDGALARADLRGDAASTVQIRGGRPKFPRALPPASSIRTWRFSSKGTAPGRPAPAALPARMAAGTSGDGPVEVCGVLRQVVGV